MATLSVDSEKTPTGLILIDSETFFNETPAPPPVNRGKRLEPILEILRGRLHATDAVLSVEPRWIAILTAADARGTQIIVERLRETLNQCLRAATGGYLANPVRMGSAVFPEDGLDIPHLFQKAKESQKEHSHV